MCKTEILNKLVKLVPETCSVLAAEIVFFVKLTLLCEVSFDRSDATLAYYVLGDPNITGIDYSRLEALCNIHGLECR